MQIVGAYFLLRLGVRVLRILDFALLGINENADQISKLMIR
jgi:hypothetical protein